MRKGIVAKELVIYLFVLSICFLLCLGCTSKNYDRYSITFTKPNGDVVVVEYVTAESNTTLVDAEIGSIDISTTTAPDGTVTRSLQAGRVTQDISEETVKALSEGVTSAVITAITGIPQ